MSRKHLTYPDLPGVVIDAARDLFDARPWSNPDRQAEVAQHVADAVCAHFDIPSVAVTLDEVTFTNNTVHVQSYDDGIEITLCGFSALNLFTGIGVVLNDHGLPYEPTDFACSLFYAVRPRRFRKLAREGRVNGVSAKDTYTIANWRKLRDANMTSGSSLLVDPQQAWEYLSAPETFPGSGDDDYSEEMQQLRESEGIVVGEDERAAMQSDGLAGCNRDALRRLAAEHDIAGRGTMTRDELETALRNAGVRVGVSA